MKKVIVNVLRWAVPAAILAYLFYDIRQEGGLNNLHFDPGNWYLLLLSLILVFIATILCIFRWYLLVNALQIRFSFITAIQLGFLGELCNFISLGSAGGDVVKAVLLARNRPGRRACAVSTILVDRVVGFYSLFLLASTSILLTGIWRSASDWVQMICGATLLMAVVGTLALAALVPVQVIAQSLTAPFSKWPMVGGTLVQVAEAFAQYRRRWDVLLAGVGISFGVHMLMAVSIFCIAAALPGGSPSLGQHMVITPLATTTGVLPLPMSGLGAFEFALENLYLHVPDVGTVAKGQGLVVALGYRIASLAVAAIGAGIYYVTNVKWAP